jgi:hypothetical protein
MKGPDDWGKPVKKKGLVPDAGMTLAATAFQGFIAAGSARAMARRNPDLPPRLVGACAAHKAQALLLYIMGVALPLLVLTALATADIPPVAIIYVLGCYGFAAMLGARVVVLLLMSPIQRPVYRIKTWVVVVVGWLWCWPGGLIALIAYAAHITP